MFRTSTHLRVLRQVGIRKLDSSQIESNILFEESVQTTQSSGEKGDVWFVSLSSSFAEFKNVGEYDANVGPRLMMGL